MNNHLCFLYMKQLGNHNAICTECGYKFELYRNWIESNLEKHQRNNPNCIDCKERLK